MSITVEQGGLFDRAMSWLAKKLVELAGVTNQQSTKKGLIELIGGLLTLLLALTSLDLTSGIVGLVMSLVGIHNIGRDEKVDAGKLADPAPFTEENPL